MAELPHAGRNPFAAGDDMTDEDAFAAAQGSGGLALEIGVDPDVARHRADTVEALPGWLHRAAEE